MRSPRRLSFSRALLIALPALLLTRTSADVVINEIMAGASERLLQFDAAGVPQVGAGPRWYQAGYDDSVARGWQTAVGPFGFGALTNNPTAIATNLQNAVRYLTPTTYFRKTFQGAVAGATDTLQLAVQYNDGFVAFLNGVEVARRNGGPARKWIYHDQPAYNRESYSGTATIPTTALAEVITLGTASTLLLPGENILAIHLMNASATEGTYYLKADLTISGSAPATLVNYNDPWKYFPGVIEPSGNLFDPALLGSGRQRVLWGTLGYDVATWLSGPGPFGYGAVGAVGTNTQTAMLNVTPSLYTRIVFNATAAQAEDGLPLRLVVGCDDGFIAYLNGVEVARRRIGLPNTFTPYDAVADSDGGVQNETILLEAASKLLVTGTNVLAVQLHNFSRSNADIYMRADLQTNASVPLVANTATWNYLVGTAEPVPNPTGEEEESFPEGPDSAADWIELHNNGSTSVSLNGWRLSDDVLNNSKWVFPDVTIPAGGYLVVVADGQDVTSNPGGYLHTNFSLDRDGEFLALYDQNGTSVSGLAPAFPAQQPFHSFGRDGPGAYRYSDLPTPGTANAGTFFSGIVATPTVNLPGRFYTGPQSVTFSCATPGAVIRYTSNGKEPTVLSTAATGPVAVNGSAVLRVRAFLDGWVPSETITHTYLLNQTVGRRSLPAACLTGDEQQVFYRPFGVFAIVNNNKNAAAGPTNYTGDIWSNHPNATVLNPPNQPEDPSLYNAPMQSGRPAERPHALEILHTDATADLRIGSYLRSAASPYSRQRYVLTSQNSGAPNAGSPWASSATEKPQINLFFRDDVGPRPVHYPFVPGSIVQQYENIRLRAGKNEIGNPFVRDEFARRTMLEMGQVTVRGDFVNVYVNAVFKGYFNITERPREPFFQEARGTNAKFDVRNIDVMADGDTLAYNELMRYARSTSIATPAGYQGLASRLDVLNVADYLLLNAYGATWDWPQNNYVLDRERASNGLFRFSVWDAEGAFGLTGRAPSSWNQFIGGSGSNALISSNPAGENLPAVLFFTVLKQNPEWRLLFADRIRKHLFNNGALTSPRLNARFLQLKTVMEPMLKDLFGGGTVMTDFATPWGDARKTAFLPQCTAQGLWPATLAPEFSQFGGNVPANFMLTILNPNANGVGTIYYTTNGLDPRVEGGAIQGTAYSAPIGLTQSSAVRARILNTNNEWSPLTETVFTLPTTAPLIVTEIMYHPKDQGATDGDDFEFIEIKNVGANPVSLGGMRFADGISYPFPNGASIAPGAFAVIARNPAQFAVRYPAVSVLGGYGPASSLNNAGELLTLVDVGNTSVFSVTYDDGPPWPGGTDGGGKSLVPVNPNAFTNPNEATQWRGSLAEHGSPGADDLLSFAEWQTLYFTPAQISDPAYGGPGADRDGDGLTNFWEFALGRDPLIADAAGAIITTLAMDGPTGPYLTLQFRRNLAATGLEFHVDTAATPGVWALDGSVPVGPSINNGDGTATETRRDTETTSTAAQRFIRLRLIGN